VDSSLLRIFSKDSLRKKIAIVVKDEMHYAIAEDSVRVIICSNNGGLTWENITEDLPYYGFDNISIEGNYVHVKAGNGLCYRRKIGAMTDMETPALSEVSSFLNVSPNPFNSVATISYKAQTEGTIKIYDIRGSIIWKSETNQGTADIIWAGNDLDNRTVGTGTYIVILESCNLRLIRKMIMTK
jgi:hypothetical protein